MVLCLEVEEGVEKIVCFFRMGEITADSVPSCLLLFAF